MFILSQRIEPLLRTREHLGFTRYDLESDRTLGIVDVDQVEKIRRDRQCELVPGKSDASALLGRERHVTLQLVEGRDAVLQLPTPVLPICCRDVLPMTLAFKPGGAIFDVCHDGAKKLGP